MLIKLNFSNGTKYPANFFRVLREIINDPTVTSINALNSKATTEGWTSTLLADLNVNTSFIVRIDNPDSTHTKAHIARTSTASASNYPFEFVLRQKIYDNSNYVYTSIENDNSSFGKYFGTGVTNAMSSSEWAPTTAIGGTSAQGTLLTVTNKSTVSNATIGSSGLTTGSTGGTFWAYVTDTSFLWAIVTTPSVMGWPAYVAPTTYTEGLYGPFIQSQYERRDKWNNSSSSVIPLFYDNRLYTSLFGAATSDFTNGLNPGSATSTECPFAIYNNILNTQPSNSTSWTASLNPQVAYGFGSRYSDYAGMTQNTSTSTTSATAQIYTKIIETTANSKVPLPDLSGYGYPLYPLTFRIRGTNANRYTLGGDVSNKGKFFMFNGDYVSGDTYIYNGKTYVLWPVYGYGMNYRLAYAVPKE